MEINTPFFREKLRSSEKIGHTGGRIQPLTTKSLTKRGSNLC
jgi:hypothetical protein